MPPIILLVKFILFVEAFKYFIIAYALISVILAVLALCYAKIKKRTE